MNGPAEYRQKAAALEAMVKRGSLRVIDDHNVALEEIVQSDTWPDDILITDLECTMCGEKFELFANTYHGSAQWSGAKGK
ncbi:hypothetical protein ACFQBQ_15845 [Granulicella cerasi]|uniref:Uncharacterized protein n=1 Tax=Granulicella cerasi TaxID=741063 RepID=A0ABW1ZE61_9BACT|nr:hypothetical protein [Granulicella cerasi]